MAWQQELNFNINKMGTKKGWCLQNARLGFGIAKGTYASAKADMLAQKAKGTLHPLPAPTNVAVPVYVDSISVYEHIMVCDHGTYYSDGKKVACPSKVFGWGEFCDGVGVSSSFATEHNSVSTSTETESSHFVISLIFILFLDLQKIFNELLTIL